MHRLTHSASVYWVSFKRGSAAKPWILYRKEESRSWPQAGTSQHTSVALQGDKACPPTRKQSCGRPHGHSASFCEAETETKFLGNAFSYNHQNARSNFFFL